MRLMRFLCASRFVFCFLLAGLTSPLHAQIINDEAFLQGDYVEVGISSCGSFGTTGIAPSGYHPRITTGDGNEPLGFVADPQRDGWDTGSPDYCGDYFLPGSPEEGFSVEVDGEAFGNFAQCSSDSIPGDVTDYVLGANQVEATWQGSRDGFQVTARTFIPLDKRYFVTQVEIENISADTLRDVYYMRNVDPDNDQTLSGNFTTQNGIVFQQPDSSEQRALVEAIGLEQGCYLGLGTKDSTARVTFGGFGNRSPSAVWNGNPPLSQSGSNAADSAISISFFAGDIAPGKCRRLAFAYILDPSDLDEALEATRSVQLSANGTNITDSLTTQALCPGLSQQLEVTNGDDYDWSWSPATGLNTTTGTSVIATPPRTMMYTATGISRSPCIPDVTFEIEVRVKPTPVARIRTTEGFDGDTLRLCNLEGFPTLLGSDSTHDTLVDYRWIDLANPSLTLSQVDSLPVTSGLSEVRAYELFVVDSGIRDVCNSGRDTMAISLKKEPEPDISLAGVAFDTLRRCDEEGALLLDANNPFDTPTTRYRWNVLEGDTTGIVSQDSVWRFDEFSDSVVVELIAADTGLAYSCETRDTAVIIYYPSVSLQVGDTEDPPDTVWFCDADGAQTLSAGDSVETVRVNYFWRDITDPANPVLLDTTREISVANFSQFTRYELEVVTQTTINCGGRDTIAVIFIPNPDSLRITFRGQPTNDSIAFCQEAGEQLLEANFAVPLPDASFQWYRYEAAQDTAFALGNGMQPSRILDPVPGTTTYILELRDERTPARCPIYDTLIVRVAPTPSLSLPDTTFICTGDEVISAQQNTPFFYDWTGPGGFTDTAAQVTPNDLGTYQVLIENQETGCRTADTTEVVAPSPIPATIRMDADTSRLCAGDTVRFTVFDSAHTSEIRYRWNLGRSSASFAEVFDAGQQEVSVELTNIRTGCVNTDTVRFRVGAYPNIQLPPVVDFCAPSDTLDLGLPTGFRYQWQGPGIRSDATQPRILVDAEGTYTLTATDSSGLCPTESSVEVIFYELPLLDLPPTQEVCQADTLSKLVATDLTHGRTIRYRWYALSDAQILNTAGTWRPDTTGRYRVEVEDTVTGCINRDTVAFFLRPNPQFSIYGADTLTCAGRDTLRLLPSEVGTAAVRWSDGSDGLTFVVTEEGQYRATLTDTRFSARCQTTRSRFVRLATPPDLPELASEFRLCQTDSIRLNAQVSTHTLDQTTYRWTQAETGNVLGTEPVLEVSADLFNGASEARLILEITDEPSGCTAQDTLQFVFTTNANPQITLSDTAVCLGDTIEVRAESTVPFRWEGGTREVERLFSPDEPGLYTLTLTAEPEGACPAVRVSRQVRIFSNPVLDLETDTYRRCGVDSVFLDAFSPEQPLGSRYRWLDSEGQLLSTDSAFWFTPADTGTFALSVSVENPQTGCRQRASLSVRLASPPATEILAPERDTLCLGERESLRARGAMQYRWTPSEETTDTLVYVAERTGWQRLILIGTNPGCPPVRDTVFRWSPERTQVRIRPEDTRTTAFCVGDTLLVWGRGAAAYRWTWSDRSFRGDTLRLPLQERTRLQLTGTDAFGCPAGQAIRMLDVVPAASVPLRVQGCADDVLAIGVPEPRAEASYFWEETAQESPTIRVSESGTYTLVSQERNCTYRYPVEAVLEPLPEIELPDDTLFCADTGALQLQARLRDVPDAPVRWRWSDGTEGATLVRETGGMLEVEAAVQYEQKVCRARTRIRIVEACEGGLFIPDAFTPNRDGLNERWQLFGAGIRWISVQVFDRWGVLRYALEKDFADIQAEDWWDGGDYPAGSYTWVIRFRSEAAAVRGEEPEVRTGALRLIR